MEQNPIEEKERYSANLITQGRHKFYSLTLPSDILGKTCYITSRDEDPIEGFQRILDVKRAKQIADYIDNGLGTIPTAIILSAQQISNFDYNNKNKTIGFRSSPKTFLIIDGQHRVFGFNLATTSVRVPVIIYSGLTRKEESRLFIDINTKQRPVPTELLLDIKAVAEYENDSETYLRNIFDKFNNESNSALFGKLSAADKAKNKISRVTFNAAIKPITLVFGDLEPENVYFILNSYLKAFTSGLSKKGIEDSLVSPQVFKAIMAIFPDVANRVKDKFAEYSIDNFNSILVYFFDRINSNKVTKKASGYKELVNHFIDALKKDFTL